MKAVQLQGFGHEHITAMHKTTLEFTQEKEVSPQGNCLVACGVFFDFEEVRSFLAGVFRVRITIQVGDMFDTLECVPNPDFCDGCEIVVRMSGVQTARTLGTHATKGSGMLKRELVERLKDPKQLVVILFEEAIE